MSNASDATQHPLARLTPEEIEQNRAIVLAAGHVTDDTLFALVNLVEPLKQHVIAGTPVDRRVRSVLIEHGTGEQIEVLTSLTERKVLLARVLDVA
ncbi:MAG: histamine oxidase, partial [Actinobacteria bacterium]|nr:histamine oxidase [Actinomycetota bacterium]